MPYHVHAWLDEPGTETFNADANTLEDAFKKAQDLQRQGFKVRVADPDGKLVTPEDSD